MTPRRTAVLLSLAALALGLTACGGGEAGSSTAAGETATAPKTSTAATAKAGKPGAGKSAGPGSSSSSGPAGSGPGGAASFETKGGDNSIQAYGGEAGGSELGQAAAALHAYLDARAGGEWARACSQMAGGVAKSLQQLAAPSQQPKAKHLGCPQLLAGMSAGMPAYLKHDLTQAEVGALRVEGDRAFLLYHGAHRSDYFMPMAKEGGRWKVAALAASALP